LLVSVQERRVAWKDRIDTSWTSPCRASKIAALSCCDSSHPQLRKIVHEFNRTSGRWLHRRSIEQVERKLDEQLEHSSPASDPARFTPGPWQSPRRKNRPSVHFKGSHDMSDQLQSPEIGPGRSENADRSAHGTRTEHEIWLHEFRNALGNITIAASAVKGELAGHQQEQIRASMRHIEEGCDRCLRLLRTMPP